MTPVQREELKQAAMKASRSTVARSMWDSMGGATPIAILSLIAQVEALTVPQGMSEKIELAWYCGYYHAGYTNDSAYAHMKAAEYAKEALSNSPEIEGIAAPTIPAIPGTKEGA